MFSRCFRGFCVEKGFGTYGKREGVVDAAGRKRVKRTEYEGLSFHELRHTHKNTTCRKSEVVQVLVGHEAESILLENCPSVSPMAFTRKLTRGLGLVQLVNIAKPKGFTGRDCESGSAPIFMQ